jgi:hypothetical protein
VSSSTEMGAPGASHLRTGDHGPKTDRSRPRSVLVNALCSADQACTNFAGRWPSGDLSGQFARPFLRVADPDTKVPVAILKGPVLSGALVRNGRFSVNLTVACYTLLDCGVKHRHKNHPKRMQPLWTLRIQTRRRR